MRKSYARPAGLVHGPDARQLITEGRGASLGGLSTIAYTLVEEIDRDGTEVSRRFTTGRLPRQTVVPPFLSPDRPLIMGIVNVTPDSFSDGGLNAQAERAIAHGIQMAKEGADILDVGGESTRPGSEGVPEAEELRRILPVIEALAGQGLTVSVDTRKANVMRVALKAGARIVNDVAALTYEPAAMQAMAEATCPVILMHAQGDPKTMQLSPRYDDVALDVFDWLEARIEACVAAGIARAHRCGPRDRLWQELPPQHRCVAPVYTLSRAWRSAFDGTFAQGFYRRADGREAGGKSRQRVGRRCCLVGS